MTEKKEYVLLMWARDSFDNHFYLLPFDDLSLNDLQLLRSANGNLINDCDNEAVVNAMLLIDDYLTDPSDANNPERAGKWKDYEVKREDVRKVYVAEMCDSGWIP